MHATPQRECRRVVLWKTVSIVLWISQDVKLRIVSLLMMNRLKDTISEDINKFLISFNISVLVLRIANENALLRN